MFQSDGAGTTDTMFFLFNIVFLKYVEFRSWCSRNILQNTVLVEYSNIFFGILVISSVLKYLIRIRLKRYLQCLRENTFGKTEKGVHFIHRLRFVRILNTKWNSFARYYYRQNPLGWRDRCRSIKTVRIAEMFREIPDIPLIVRDFNDPVDINFFYTRWRC